MECFYTIKEECLGVKQEDIYSQVLKEEVTIEQEVFQNIINTKFTEYNDLLLRAPRICSLCDKVFENSFTFLQHNASHLQVKLNKFSPLPCQRCSEWFNTKAELESHIKCKHLKLKHGNDRLEKCEICNKIFSRKYWHSHIKNVHYAKNHTCPICNNGRAFKTDITFKRHLMFVHNKERPHKAEELKEFKCSLCPKIFFNKDSARLHFTGCHISERAVCNVCGALFRNKTHLRVHISRVHYDDGNVYDCGVCGKTFSSPRRVRIHIKNSHKSLSVQRYFKVELNKK